MKKRDLGERMLRAIRRVMLKTSQYSRSLAQLSGLTLPQLLCLRAIEELSHEHDEVTAVAVAYRVGLAAPTVSRILERMERGQLIERSRSSPDRRRVLIRLTPTGEQRLAGIPTPLQGDFVDRVAALDEDSRKRIIETLEQVVELMDSEELNTEPMIDPEYDTRVPRPPE